MLKCKKTIFWRISVGVIVAILVGIGFMNTKKAESDLSFLNPEQLANVLIQEESRDIKVADYSHNGYIQFKSFNISQWIIDTDWKEKKADSLYELPVTYAILNIHSEDTKSEIRFFESNPTLVMVVYEDAWRYYTISKESYDNFVFMLLASSSFIPFKNEKVDASISDKNISIPTEVDKLITAHFDAIMDAPITSSNPYDYIKANQSIFDEIVSYGDSALIYCFYLFEQGGQNDLKGHLMLHVCNAIQPEARNDIGYETGQLWYDELKKQAYKLKEIYSMDELEKHYPTYYLLLKLLSEGFGESMNEIRLSNFTYNGDDEILKLVYGTEIEKYLEEDRFLIPAAHIHGKYEEENRLKVIATIYHNSYKLYGEKVKSVGGGVIPVAITYRRDSNNNYILEEYVQSRDGSEFGPSIKEFCTYPVSGKEISGLADRIMNHYSDYEDLHQLQRSNLIEHLNRYHLTGISMVTNYDDSVELLN